MTENQSQVGQNNANSRLTPDDVREIRDRYGEGSVTQTALGDEYGVSPRQIGYIVRRERWADLDDETDEASLQDEIKSIQEGAREALD